MTSLPPGLAERLPATVRQRLSGAPGPAALLAAATAAADAAMEAEASALALRALDAAPDDAALRLRVALLQARLRRPATALRAAAPALAAARDNPQFADLLGMTGDTLRRRSPPRLPRSTCTAPASR